MFSYQRVESIMRFFLLEVFQGFVYERLSMILKLDLVVFMTKIQINLRHWTSCSSFDFTRCRRWAVQHMCHQKTYLVRMGCSFFHIFYLFVLWDYISFLSQCSNTILFIFVFFLSPSFYVTAFYMFLLVHPLFFIIIFLSIFLHSFINFYDLFLPFLPCFHYHYLSIFYLLFLFVYDSFP